MQEDWDRWGNYRVQATALRQLVAAAPALAPNTLVVLVDDARAFPATFTFEHALEYLYGRDVRGLAWQAPEFLYGCRQIGEGMACDPWPVIQAPWGAAPTVHRFDEIVVARRRAGRVEIAPEWPAELGPLPEGARYSPGARILPDPVTAEGAPDPRSRWLKRGVLSYDRGAMSATLLDGAAIAGRIRAELRDAAGRLAERGRRPGLGVLLVGRRSRVRGVRPRKDPGLRRGGTCSTRRVRLPASAGHRRGPGARHRVQPPARRPRDPRPAPAAPAGGRRPRPPRRGPREGRRRLPSRKRRPPGAETAALRALHAGRDHGAAAAQRHRDRRAARGRPRPQRHRGQADGAPPPPRRRHRHHLPLADARPGLRDPRGRSAGGGHRPARLRARGARAAGAVVVDVGINRIESRAVAGKRPAA